MKLKDYIENFDNTLNEELINDESSFNFIEQSEKNTKKYNSSVKKNNKSVPLLKEVTGGTVSGFVGRGGIEVDQLYAGGYHPDSGYGSQNLQLLQKQLKDRKKLIDDFDIDEANPVGGWFDIETEALLNTYDYLGKISAITMDWNASVTPEADIEWVPHKQFMKFDASGEAFRFQKPKYDYVDKSESNIKKIKYDDEKPRYNKEDYINKSKTNWKLVGG